MRYVQITDGLERLDVARAREMFDEMPALRIVDAQLATESITDRPMADSLDRFQRDRVATTVDINPSIWTSWCESIGLEDVDIDGA